jgi:hypothetical protein
MAHREGITAAFCSLLGAALALSARAFPAETVAAPAWSSPQRYRFLLEVDPLGRKRSNSPASVEIDFTAALRDLGGSGTLDESTIEVIACDGSGAPQPFDAGRPGAERYLLPWRVQWWFGTGKASLSFVVPDHTLTRYAVYFDTPDSGLGKPRRYPGLVGDGDFFREGYGSREIATSHFDQFCDFDRDGDLDLFKGGVEPYVECYENVGGNRLVCRGRLTSGGRPLALPASESNRSWLAVAFQDWDGDGDLDFFPSFMDGPDRGAIVFYRNDAPKGSAEPAFSRVGRLATASGVPVAGGAQAGGWFPSLAFAGDWDGEGDGRTDLLVGSNDRCYLYRNLGTGPDGLPRLAEAVALRAGGSEIVLPTPRFDCADLDGDGDLDLFAGSQPGPVYWFRNIGSRAHPELEAGRVVAFGGKYLIADAHSGVKAADFDGDGLMDLVAGRFWERIDLSDSIAIRDHGGLFRQSAGAAGPRFERATLASPYTVGFQICDAARQNSCRAVDWDGDGMRDLLAGDTDGFVWLWINETDHRFPVFRRGERVLAGGKPINLSAAGGHARLDASDLNGDGLRDLIVADGGGGVILFSRRGDGSLAAGRPVLAGEKPIQGGARSSVLACDWDGDGLLDLLLAGDRSYSICRGRGPIADPAFESPRPLTFRDGPVRYVRPNLGSFVDWDGDGKRDLLACRFENDVRFYRNLGPGGPRAEPEFASSEGEVILRSSSPQMISGVDAVDWNGDGDLDLLTGQGHGGSGLRFYERDFIEDELHGTHPRVRIAGAEARPLRERGWVDFLGVVRRYADAMLSHGRDVFGPVKSGLFLSALDRGTLAPLTVRPAAPAGIRRGDRPGRAWSAMNGANPHLDQNLLRVLDALTEITGDPRYRQAVDEELTWFFKNALSSETSLLPWGEHLSWDVVLDRAISGGDEAMHEFARPWVYWERCFALVPEESRRFALGLWEHQIADQKTGGFDRHAPYFKHGPVDGKDFPRHGAFYLATWCYAWRHTKDPVFLKAMEAILGRFERKRVQKDGTLSATLGPLDCETAAGMVPEPLASRLRAFAAKEDQLIIAGLEKQILSTPPPRWRSGYSAGTLASEAMFCLARFEQSRKEAYRAAVLLVADAYLDSLPEEDVDAWPLSFAHAISAEAAAYRFTGSEVYREQAVRLAKTAVELFWQDRPLPRASLKTGHYETITGADSLALALLEAHQLAEGLPVVLPLNSIDR